VDLDAGHALCLAGYLYARFEDARLACERLMSAEQVAAAAREARSSCPGQATGVGWREAETLRRLHREIGMAGYICGGLIGESDRRQLLELALERDALVYHTSRELERRRLAAALSEAARAIARSGTSAPAAILDVRQHVALARALLAGRFDGSRVRLPR
jgi:hypothetical protein